MAATDDTFALMIGRARAREKAFLAAADRLPDGNFSNLDQTFLRIKKIYLTNRYLNLTVV